MGCPYRAYCKRIVQYGEEEGLSMEVVYEASGRFPPSIQFIILCVVDAVFTVVCCSKLRRFLIGEVRPFTIGEKIFFGFIIFFLTGVVVITVVSGFDAKKIYAEYQAGKAQIVEGEISDYRPNLEENEAPDHFDVNDLSFEIPGGTTPWGYPLRQQDGGELADGVYVKIYYVVYKYENVIMRLEIKRE